MRIKQSWYILGLFLVITLIMIIRYMFIDHTATAEWGYINAGAINPYYGVSRPFGYRLFMPVLLNMVGIVPKPGDALVPVSFAVIMCLFFYAFLRALQFNYIESAFGTIFLALVSGMTDLLRDFGINNTDTSSHIFILLALIAMIKKNDSLFSLATMLGVFNREWALVLIPAWYLYFYGFYINKHSILRLARISLPSIAVYLMIRYIYFPNCALGVMGRDLASIMPAFETTTFQYYLTQIKQINWSDFSSRVFSYSFYEFGLIPLLPFAVRAFIIIPREWKLVCLYYAALCVLQLTFTTDVWRLAFYLFPVMLPLFLYWLKHFAAWGGTRSQLLIGSLAASIYLLWPYSLWSLFCETVLCGGVEWYRYGIDS